MQMRIDCSFLRTGRSVQAGGWDMEAKLAVPEHEPKIKLFPCVDCACDYKRVPQCETRMSRVDLMA